MSSITQILPLTQLSKHSVSQHRYLPLHPCRFVQTEVACLCIHVILIILKCRHPPSLHLAGHLMKMCISQADIYPSYERTHPYFGHVGSQEKGNGVQQNYSSSPWLDLLLSYSKAPQQQRQGTNCRPDDLFQKVRYGALLVTSVINVSRAGTREW